MRPKNLLIYYGWLNAYNSAENEWRNENVAIDMSKYSILVFGDGVQDPSHGDFENSQIIINRLKEINPEILIFGYVTVNQTLSAFTTKARQWDDLEIRGIFMDEAGYDYGKNRTELNNRIDIVHSLEDANTCFLNAWNIDNVVGLEEDASYPNSIYNSGLVESNIDVDDWYLLESFVINTSAYGANGGYANSSDWFIRGNKAVERREEYGFNLASVGIINDENIIGHDLFNFSHRSALVYNLNANGTSDTGYGAASAKTKYWERPEPHYFIANVNFAVVADNQQSDAYFRNFPYMRVNLDFDSKISSVTQW
jgi:hypothetical protein